MEQRQAAGVLGHEHERRRADDVGDAEALGEALRELRLAGAEVADEAQQVARARDGGQPGARGPASRARRASSRRGRCSREVDIAPRVAEILRPMARGGVASAVGGSGQAKRSRSPIGTSTGGSPSISTHAASRWTFAAYRRWPARPTTRPSRPAWAPPRMRTQSGSGQREVVGRLVEHQRGRVDQDRDVRSRPAARGSRRRGSGSGAARRPRAPAPRTAASGGARRAGAARTPGSRAAPCRGAPPRRSRGRPSRGRGSAPRRRCASRRRGCSPPGRRRSRPAGARRRGRSRARAARAPRRRPRTRRGSRGRRPGSGARRRGARRSPRRAAAK